MSGPMWIRPESAPAAPFFAAVNSGRPTTRGAPSPPCRSRDSSGSSGGSPDRDPPDRPGRAASASDRRSRRRRGRASLRRSRGRRPWRLPSLVATRATAAPVRISAPNPFAAAARACVSAPIPPRTNVAAPAALPSSAAPIRMPRLVPADHGPAKVPKMPRAATVARRSSVSNHSATRSATAIGPQRSRRNASRFGRAAELAADAEQLPELAERTGRRSTAASSSGRARGACRSGRATRGTRGSPSRLRRDSSDVRRRARGVVVERNARPSGPGAKTRTSVWMRAEPVTVEAEVPRDRRAETVRRRGATDERRSPARIPP